MPIDTRRLNSHAEAGFTLIELMVALVVFLILAALAIPGFTTYLEKSRVRGAADSVVNQIAQARQVAVKYDREVSLATTVTGSDWCLGALEAADPAPGQQATGAAACNCNTAPAACLVDGREMVVAKAQHRDIALSSHAATLTFDGRLGVRSDASVGNADASSFALTSPSGRYSLTVRVSPLGQASVCTTTGNILGYPSC
jgi:type IV fimbrial biogenesis protein FimT